MRKITIAAALIAIPAIAFAAREVGDSNGRMDMSPVRSISVSGTAERKIAPDQAHVMVNFGATNLKLEAAKAEHDKKLKQVMDITKKVGIEDAQVKTQNSSIQPQYTWENNKQNFKGYRVQTMLDITLKKAEMVGDLVEKLSSAGLENGSGQEWGNLINVNYAIGNPDKIRDEMLADAIKNARAKAENMATAAGGTVGDVIQINEGDAPQLIFPPRPMMAMAASLGGGAADKAVSPPVGEQEVNANVTVIFELK